MKDTSSPYQTGPRTEQGKARSSSNSTTHGLTSSRPIVKPEEQPAFDALCQAYLTEATPVGAIENTLFDQLINAAWKLTKIPALEARLEEESGDDAILSDNPSITKKFDRLQRYQTAAERTVHRCLNQLKQLQNQRLALEQFRELYPPNGPRLANIAAFTKRMSTHLQANLREELQKEEQKANNVIDTIKSYLKNGPLGG